MPKATICFFQGLQGDSLLIEGMANHDRPVPRSQSTDFEICETGTCIALPTPVAGRGNIGDQAVSFNSYERNVRASGEIPTPGLAQEWYATGNPGSKDGVEAIFNSERARCWGVFPRPTVRRGGRAIRSHSVTWSSIPKKYSHHSTTLTTTTTRFARRAKILIPESGTYRFTDGVDDFTWLAVDADGSGVAGDDPDEVLIDDNAWTGVFREQNNGGGGLGEIEPECRKKVAKWLAIEFNMSEGGGSDAGVVYWDYNPDAPEGDRLNGAEGFPEVPEDPIDPADAELMYIPDSHLRSVTRETAERRPGRIDRRQRQWLRV